jgi:hypothetical protein
LKPSVYLETTVPSLLTAWPSRDILVAGQQQATRDWWDERRRKYRLCISGLVLLECRRGDSAAVREREAVLNSCEVLHYSDAARDLAEKLIESRLLPAKAAVDAAHIAIASVHQMDYLLTWNCRHIANAAIVEDVRALCSDAGHPDPVICTPLELML